MTRYPRPDRPHEAPAVRTTIVGGRPPGTGTGLGPIPRGLEVLVKKAAVDIDFRALLLADREAAATSIALELTPAERAMLAAVPGDQLARIVEHASVPPQLLPAFLGRAAAVMLAALTTGVATGCKSSTETPAEPAPSATPELPTPPSAVEIATGAPSPSAELAPSASAAVAPAASTVAALTTTAPTPPPRPTNTSVSRGIRPDPPYPAPTGIRPDRPDKPEGGGL